MSDAVKLLDKFTDKELELIKTMTRSWVHVISEPEAVKFSKKANTEQELEDLEQLTNNLLAILRKIRG